MHNSVFVVLSCLHLSQLLLQGDWMDCQNCMKPSLTKQLVLQLAPGFRDTLSLREIPGEICSSSLVARGRSISGSSRIYSLLSLWVHRYRVV